MSSYCAHYHSVHPSVAITLKSIPWAKTFKCQCPQCTLSNSIQFMLNGPPVLTPGGGAEVLATMSNAGGMGMVYEL